MMYCTRCGNRFEIDDARMFTEPHGEKTPCCPRCNSSYIEEQKRCEICGKWFIGDDLDPDVCTDCAREFITEERFERFGLQDAEPNEVSIFEEFVWEYVLGLSPLMESNTLLKDVLRNAYETQLTITITALDNFLARYNYEWADFLIEEVKKDAQ